MTYIELQKALRQFRDNGTELTVKLNATKELLKAEYDRLTSVIAAEPEEELVIESVAVVKEVVTEVIQNETNDNYWSSWDDAYFHALNKIATERYRDELTSFSNRWESKINDKLQASKDNSTLEHEQIGLVLVTVCYMLFEMTFTELSKAYQFVYGILQKTNLKQLVPSVIRVYQNV